MTAALIQDTGEQASCCYGKYCIMLPSADSFKIILRNVQCTQYPIVSHWEEEIAKNKQIYHLSQK